MKKKITKKETIEFLNKVADIKKSDSPGLEMHDHYFSKVDGSYMTMKGMEDMIHFLIRLGITDQIQNGTGHTVANIGFNPEEQKWYGWSHRAVFGFGVGSECKKGDCHYHAPSKEEFLEDMVRFWTDEFHNNVAGIEAINEKGDLGLQITWEYDSSVPNKDLHSTIGETFCYYPKQFGRGEWTAKNLDDARRMACDFAEGVG